MTLLLGIDLGTSSVKVGLFDAVDLTLKANASVEYTVSQPHPRFVEQNPDEWVSATEAAVRKVMHGVDPNQVKGIGLDGQMHGIVCVGRDHRPVHPAIIWADSRSVDEIEALAQFQKSHRPRGISGRPSTGFAASTLRWLSRHRPEILAKTYQILHPKDYVRLCFTGQLFTDLSDASASWLLNVENGEWLDHMAAFCGIRLNQLPPILKSIEVCGELRPKPAQMMGLLPNTPVVAGASDLAAQALGHGIIDNGDILITVGTGGQVMTPVSKPSIDPEGRTYTFHHCIPDMWYLQAAILSAGMSLRWLRDMLGLNDDPRAYAKLSAMAAEVPPGAEGLIFLPYLAGERTPHFDPDASGGFFGLRLHHRQAHLSRAVMEGVSFALLDCLNLIHPTEIEQPIILSGGISQSPIWCQIMADIIQRPIFALDSKTPRASLGSAILAGIGVQYIDSFETAKSLINQNSFSQAPLALEPDIQNRYQDRYAQFKRLYPLLSEEMVEIRST
ncbi:MAG: xylulokinase [Chloroflexota bacterium]